MCPPERKGGGRRDVHSISGSKTVQFGKRPEKCARCSPSSKKALHQVQGRSFKTMRSLQPARSTRASFTSTIDDPCTDSLRGNMQTHSDTSRTVPQCSIASDMGGTVALAVNNPIMETGICPDLGEHTDVNVDGTNNATGSARRRRYGNTSLRVPFCFSGSDHDKLVANVESCIVEADPSVPVPLGVIGSDNGEKFDVNADSPTSGDANSFAIEREAVSLRWNRRSISSCATLLGHSTMLAESIFFWSRRRSALARFWEIGTSTSALTGRTEVTAQ